MSENNADAASWDAFQWSDPRRRRMVPAEAEGTGTHPKGTTAENGDLWKGRLGRVAGLPPVFGGG
jgi:hypothetical protein